MSESRSEFGKWKQSVIESWRQQGALPEEPPIPGADDALAEAKMAERRLLARLKQVQQAVRGGEGSKRREQLP